MRGPWASRKKGPAVLRESSGKEAKKRLCAWTWAVSYTRISCAFKVERELVENAFFGIDG